MISQRDILRAKTARLLEELEETNARVASSNITAAEHFDRKVDFLVEFLKREFSGSQLLAETDSDPQEGDDHPQGVERWMYTGNGVERASPV